MITIGTAWLFYNELRAQGYEPKVALALTGLDRVVSVPGLGVSNVTDAIKQYRDIEANAARIALGLGTFSDAPNAHILRNPAVQKGRMLRDELGKLGIDSTAVGSRDYWGCDKPQ